MKIKNITPRIKLLPCRYCGRAPERKTESQYSALSFVVVDKIRCKYCDANYVKNVGCFGDESEVVFTKPTAILWNEHQREVN